MSIMSIIYWDNAQQIAISVVIFFDRKLQFCMAKSNPFSSIHNPCRCSVAETLQAFWQFVTVHFVVILEFIEDLSSIGLRSTWLTPETTKKKVVYIWIM